MLSIELKSTIPRPIAIVAALAAMTLPVMAESPPTTGKVGIATTKPAEGPSVEIEGGFMVPYTTTIPGTDVTIDMVPIPAGQYLMGSSEEEDDHNEDEGPQVKVIVDPMWVAKTETSWAQYKEYMRMYAIFKEFEANGERKVSDENMVDAITAPTELYDPTFTFEYGEDPQQPAVTMTQYSAQQFTKWLSLVTGEQYRLPTEAEWEFACRAGTTTAYSWGDDSEEMDEYAWFFDNANDGPAKVGTKLPNAFGLHDMHGNVAELTVNAFTEDYSEYKQLEPVNAIDVVKWPETSSGSVARGGSWEGDPETLRSASRIASDDDSWKEDDPNFPKSPWWFTNDPARGVGFRIFRSYRPLSSDKITKFWEASSDEVISDIDSRVQGGRGGYGLVDPTLPDAIKKMDN